MLNRAVVALQTGRMPRDCRQWLLQGLNNYRKGLGRLDDCLGLSVLPGKSSVPVQLKLELRDMYLKAAGSVTTQRK